MSVMESGIWIVLEGGDGAGKSTQARHLAERLQGLGWDAILTREPGGTDLGARIRELLLHGEHVDPRAEALLYAADRAHHIANVVQPALAAGKAVIQDRFIDSSVAYQGAGRGFSPTEILSLNGWAVAGARPDLTVLLDIDADASLSRAAARGGELDRLEAAGSEFHRQVRAGFLAQAKAQTAAGANYLVLDATSSPEKLSEQIWAAVSQLLNS